MTPPKKKKPAKKAAKSTNPKVVKLTVNADGSFKVDPTKLKKGNLLKIVGPLKKDLDFTVAIDVGDGDNGGGGGVVIHS